MRKNYETISGDARMIKAISIKDKLKNQATLNGKTMQEMLTLYGLERTVYRISVSDYADRFTLKGGIFLYALFNGDFTRTTRDIDLLAENIANNSETMQSIFTKIFSIDCDDALRYDLSSLEVQNITEFKEYHGVNVSIMAYLDNTRVPISIDIGFGDVIYPNKSQIQFPALLNMESPKIYAYSIYSAISEKFEAIVSLGNANSRYKDFYDIYILASNYSLEGHIFKNAIIETFNHRETELNDIVAFENEFAQNELHQNRWNAFLRKKKTMITISFSDMLTVIRQLFIPIVESIVNGNEFYFTWDYNDKKWK